MVYERTMEIVATANLYGLALKVAPEIIACAEDYGALYNFDTGLFEPEDPNDARVAMALNRQLKANSGALLEQRHLLRPGDYIELIAPPEEVTAHQ